MREIICYQCETPQSFSRDICIECGVFMRRDAQYLRGVNQESAPVVKPNVPLRKIIEPSAEVPSTPLPPDTPMICCDKCYEVQLAEEKICIGCKNVMKRTKTFIFPAKMMTSPYHGRPPKSAEDQGKVASLDQPSNILEKQALTEVVIDREVVPNQPFPQPVETALEPKPIPVAKATQKRICCHACFAVQDAAHNHCEKCNLLMQRDPQYLFDAPEKG